MQCISYCSLHAVNTITVLNRIEPIWIGQHHRSDDRRKTSYTELSFSTRQTWEHNISPYRNSAGKGQTRKYYFRVCPFPVLRPHSNLFITTCIHL